ncbi:MAG: T9SS type A sorting domain-containing protein [Bacteroidales bacterium]|nr:T9SS type A sorting domain-containing protein [Bacteroidales bacterium]
MKFKSLFILALSLALSVMTYAQTIDVVGKGVHNTPIETLHFTDLASIDYVVVEAVYKTHLFAPTGPVTFSDSDESIDVYANSVEFVRTDIGNDYGTNPNYFTATFNTVGPEGITLNQLANFGGMHSFVAYVFRTETDPEYISYGDFNHVFMFRNGSANAYNYVIPINPSNNPREVDVKVTISEMAYDDRVCIINVTAGSQTQQQVFSQPNLGDALNITPFTLTDVPGDVTQVTVSIYSPPYYTTEPNGDSFITGAVILDVEQDKVPGLYCTLTQGFYGNYGGQYNGISTYDLLFSLLSTDLVLGAPGRSLTLTQADVDCLIGRLPGGGKPEKLKHDATCADPDGIKLHNDGRYKNSLLAQAITLGLNLRLTPELGDLLLSDIDFLIPNKIIEKLGGNATIFDLYDLANAALADEDTMGAKNGDITDAMGSINDYFDECATFNPPNGDCGPCDGQMTSLSLEYLGYETNATVKVYKDKVQADKLIATFYNVNTGDTLVFTGTGNDNKLGAKVRLTINDDDNNYVEIHTSCSQPIEVGMVYENLYLLIAGTSHEGGPLCNGGSGGGGPECGPCDGQMTSLSLEYLGYETNATVKVYKDKVQADKLIATFYDVNTGDTLVFTGTGNDNKLGAKVRLTINDDDNNYVEIHTSCSQPIEVGMVYENLFLLIAGTSHEGGPLCEGGSGGGGGGPECGPCEGQMTSLSLEYLGTTSNATVKVYTKKVEPNNLIATFYNVNTGDTLDFTGTGKHNKLGSKVRITINGDNNNFTEIHTSCSQPIEVGMIYDNLFLLIAGTSHEGGPLCEMGNKSSSPFFNVVNLTSHSYLNAYPNPIVAGATIEFEVAELENTSIELINIQGQVVSQLYKGIAEPGNKYSLLLQASNLNNGIYILRMINGSEIVNMKLSIAK